MNDQVGDIAGYTYFKTTGRGDMTLETFLSNVRYWLMSHHVRSGTVLLCILVAGVVALFLLKLFRPPKV
jgi:hypothetical protein